MGIRPSILFGHVMHKRLFPRINAFSYSIFYLVLPLTHMKKNTPLAVNRFGMLSFYEKDHGRRDGSDLEKWAQDILQKYGVTEANGEIVLVTMPRVLGYVFNPVSFWICYDNDKKIRAVLCEVNNTFGETHTYLCAHPDHTEIKSDDVLEGQKVFHVSPFLPREGYYTFRFSVSQENCGFWINYHDSTGEKQLVTSLTGRMKLIDQSALSRAFWTYPFVTMKAVALIHWQAAKLIMKGIKYIPRPAQEQEKISATRNITNF